MCTAVQTEITALGLDSKEGFKRPCEALVSKGLFTFFESISRKLEASTATAEDGRSVLEWSRIKAAILQHRQQVSGAAAQLSDR